MVEFACPWLLLTLLVIPPGVWWVLTHRRASVVTTSIRPFRAAAPRRRFRGGVWEWCILGALTLSCIALARPRLGDEQVIVRTKGIDIIIALDLSGSMSAYDTGGKYPDTASLVEGIRRGEALHRLAVAKREVKHFIERRPNDRIGLVGFASLAYSLVPPTLDHALLLQRLAALEPYQLGDGTGIASALGIGILRLRKSDAPRRVLVLFTDGANNVNNRLTPAEAAALAKESKVIIHTVGIGSGKAVAIARSLVGQRPVTVQDMFDETLLKELASVSGGSYFHAADEEGMSRVMTEINALEKTAIEHPRYMEYREYAPTLAWIAALLLLFGCCAEATFALRAP